MNANFSEMHRNLHQLFAINTNRAENIARSTSLLYLFKFRIFLSMNLKPCRQNEITGLRFLVALFCYKICHLNNIFSIASGVGLSLLYWDQPQMIGEGDWQGKPKYSEKPCISATLSTTNPTWPDLGSNPGRRGEKFATYLKNWI
jgi:hypothetical protein